MKSIVCLLALLVCLVGCGRETGVVSTAEEYEKFNPDPAEVEAYNKSIQNMAAEQAAEMKAAAAAGN